MNGTELKTTRILAKLTQQQLGDRIGLTRFTINAYENNKKPIPKNKIPLLKIVLGIDRPKVTLEEIADQLIKMDLKLNKILNLPNL